MQFRRVVLASNWKPSYNFDPITAMKGRLDLQFRHPAESHAWQFLAQKGHCLLRHNFHVRFCELDLISLDEQQILHCVEVKAWRSNALLHPLESISDTKKRKIQRAMLLFIQAAMSDAVTTHLISQFGCRSAVQNLAVSFDLIWCKSDSFEWYKALF